ncbi:hypothetical protein G6011_11422 [Alternaria panax]|uniref:RING-type domain-containing protein n=1 Tax=Alternaria panax TaxID=48097 RepID=A0AAD4IDT8_9PLEO|nr:hypothetical protein G6011_11422 [Alternaria panax]
MEHRQPKETADAERRISVRKKRAVQYGRKTIRIQVADRQEFTISEDLLCSTSGFFQRRLQPKRKPFDEDTECSICKEKLEPGVNDLVYCTAHCGSNFHYNCIERWRTEKREARQKIKCPFCRHDWPENSNEIAVHENHDIRPDPFSIFIEWLYHSHIAVEFHLDGDELDETPEPQIKEFIDAYVLGIKLKSSMFCRDVLEALLETSEETSRYPGPDAIHAAYNNTTRGSVLRLALIQLYANAAEAHWFKEEEDNDYPREFLQDLTAVLLEKDPDDRKWGLAKMKAEFITEEAIAHEGFDNDDEPEEVYNPSEQEHENRGEEMGAQNNPIVVDS